ncbi:helix-turn-helix family protein [Bacteroides fragilis str. S23 R14]|nr:helix-turn-helix family protein [Bacteroides fragilis str. 3783N2-1]EXZ97911.1 helix-turn-helix family protein [Bacteroides fragilis str. S23 R14]EYA63043.1 helix-turn-helix family protein [Bacteroides fragilis str. A7 (UDC12-2)]KAB5478163.1 helix-turn-helix transcriptional regulator [Bacteroides fragilis]EXZ97932.1 helix-turn-helix family protein [Bacteroides fragilis str. S23 R14]
MLGINQQTLADLAQISINTITKIENGEININFQKLYAILEVLGLELSLKIKNKEGHL